MTEPQIRAGRLWERLGRLGYGADYYPEQWEPDIWREDAELMQAAGVNFVRVGIFAWALVEPRPGHFEFGWLDQAMDRLHAAGAAVCLATGTASPPPWLASAHPQTLPVTSDGATLWPGSRQHYCPSSLHYRAAAAALTERVAQRYAGHPGLALWHVGNEFGCHVPACYCDESARDFRRWLRERYGDLDALNAAWSTAFWSQRYDRWEEINPPRRAPTFANPAQQLDFARFCSDALRACFEAERDILRRLTPQVPVTTNFLGLFKPVDGFGWAPAQDVIALDSYPDPADPTDEATLIDAAFVYDLMRSQGGGRPWILMEQAPSAVNWRPRNAPKPPGVMRLWSCRAIARGADAVMFFQWRQSVGGAEKFHSAMVPHGGTKTRIWRETSEFGREAGQLGPVLGSRVRAEAAVTVDWASWWALELDAHPSSGLSLPGLIRHHYRPLWRAGITSDVVHPEQDLAAYKLIIVPNLYLVDDAAAANLVSFVRGGGHLLMSFFSGIVDPSDRVRLGGYPGPFRQLLGLRVDEFWPMAEGAQAAVRFVDDGSAFSGTLWQDAIVLEGAEPVAAYTDGPLAGTPAVTRHQFGSGAAWYLGTLADENTMDRIVTAAAAAAGVAPALPGLPSGVEAVRRHGDDASYLFLLNHTDAECHVNVPGPVRDLLAGPVATAQAGQATVTLGPRGVAVLTHAGEAGTPAPS